jgi:hypothetical protein
LDFRLPKCQSLSGEVLDELVTEKLLEALEPAALELNLLAADDLQQERRRVDEHWGQRLERARYQVDRANRQYKAVEPENRLVARELERQWESALRNLQELEQQYVRFRHAHPPTLSVDQRELIRTLSENLPAVWRAPTTTNCDRQRIVRLLLDRVVVAVKGTTEQVEVVLHWSGGFTSRHNLVRPVRRYEQTAEYERLKSLIADLQKRGQSYAEIAKHLNSEGFRPTKQTKEFDKSIVGRLAKKLCRDRSAPRKIVDPIPLRDGEWYVTDLAAKLDLPRSTLMSWAQYGWVHTSRKLAGYHGRIIFWADESELDRLRRLRRTKHHFGDPPLPKELTTPNVHPIN